MSMRDTLRSSLDFRRRWPDFINLVLGLALLCSPFALHFADRPAALWNAVACGVIIGAIAVAGIVSYQPWKEGAALLVGLWLILSPWILGYVGAAVPTWTDLLFGVWTAVFALLEFTLMQLWLIRAHSL